MNPDKYLVRKPPRVRVLIREIDAETGRDKRTVSRTMYRLAPITIEDLLDRACEAIESTPAPAP